MVFTIEGALIIILALVYFVLILIFIAGNNKKSYSKESYITREFYSLGTLNHLKIYGKKAEEARLPNCAGV